MLNEETIIKYTEVLKEELVPAMGCTEPIAIAYAAALARKTLGMLPEKTNITVSSNIIKNVKSVIVPNTGGLKGIETAVAAGFIAGDAEKELEVLSSVGDSQKEKIAEYLKSECITVIQSKSDRLFEISVEVTADDQTAKVDITDSHTGVSLIEKNGEILHESSSEQGNTENSDRCFMTVEGIVEYANKVSIDDVRETLDRQIEYNTAIAKEGLSGKYGASIGKILMLTNGNTVANRAKAWAAAGSDARMNGCELPVIINSGSGNQGMTASLPVIVYAQELNVSKEKLYRALLISNLVTIRLKTGIGCLSAYCGAVSAGCGAGAGITYLYGGGYDEIAHTIVNAIAINSGIVCDGAKASCAAKIASAVEAGILGMQMYMHGKEFVGGDGLVTKGIERTIENISSLARNGMRDTDKEIIKIMMEC